MRTRNIENLGSLRSYREILRESDGFNTGWLRRINGEACKHDETYLERKKREFDNE